MEINAESNKKKLEKIAAARKKLKQYQQKTPKPVNSKSSEKLNEITSPQEDLAIQTHQPTGDEAANHGYDGLSTFTSTTPPTQENVIDFSKFSNENNEFNQFNVINFNDTNNSSDNVNEMVNNNFGSEKTFFDVFGSPNSDNPIPNTTYNTNNYINNNNNTNNNNQYDSTLVLQKYFSYDSNNLNLDPEINQHDPVPSEPIQTTGFTEVNFFNNVPSGSDDSDKLLNSPFNLLKITQQIENNSETISTISEHTENDSSLGLGFVTTGISGNNDKDIFDISTPSKGESLDIGLTTNVEVVNKTNKQLNTVQAIDYEILYQSEKIKTNELNFKLDNQQKLIDELKFNLEKSKSNHQILNSSQTEIGHLNEQLKNHTTTIGILVGEKTELSSSLNKLQILLQDKLNDFDELNSKLSASRHKVSELEKDFTQSKASCDRLITAQKKFIEEIELLQDENNKLKMNNVEIVEENAILNKKVEIKYNELTKIENEFKVKLNEIEMYKLKIDQLTSDDVADNAGELNLLKKQNDNYLLELNELKARNDQHLVEKEQLNQHYQNYLQHLNNEIGNMTNKCSELNVEKERLVKRERELVKHVSELEKNLQQIKTNRIVNEQKEIENIVDDQKYIEEIEKMTSRIIDLERQTSHVETDKELLETVKFELAEKNDELNRLKLTIERLTSDRPDPTNIMASMESDRLAASRAVSQNVELKNQLEEIQKAFVQISNDKLEITDRLQTEQHLCREMKNRYTEMEQELQTIRDKFNFKDQEMIRLAHENTKLSQEILQFQQELDRLRHYEAKNHLGSVLQIELQNANDQIAYLRSRIKDNESKKESVDGEVPDGTNIGESENNVEKKDEEDELMTSSNFMIASHEAMEKLQNRFRRTMDEIADLTEEKQKLEHLVMQLQGETETIGEYVALYQTQRRLLKQRETEKDVELHKLAEDREQMKNKLTYLNNLIEQLLLERGVNPPMLNNLTNGDERQIETIELPQSPLIDQLISETHIEKQKTSSSNDTAVKILNLLEEIKVVNNSMDSLQHCPCCSGKWETV